MMKLAELQSRFGRALLCGNDDGLTTWLRDDGIRPESLLDIYRDSVFASLTSVLGATFAVVSSLVGDDAFRRIAEGFVRDCPPTQPCLDEYGERFAEFLALSDASQGLPYLSDLARLEWLVHRAAHAPDRVPLSALSLRRATQADPKMLVARLDPSIGWLKSPFPVDSIWSGKSRKSAVADLGCYRQGVCIEVRRCAGRVALSRLDHAVHAFRVAIGSGESLAVAGQSANRLQPGFELVAALAELLRSDAVVSIDIQSTGGRSAEGRKTV